MQGTWVQSLCRGDPLEDDMATHSSILAWEILQTEETGRPQSMGLQRIRHNWSNGTQRTHSILFEHSPWGTVTWFTPILQITLAQIPLTQFFPGYVILKWKLSHAPITAAAAAAVKSLQSWPTLCDPIDGSPPGSAIPGILQARTLEWVAISSSNAWKWKVEVKSLSCVWLSATPRTAAHQAPPPMGFSRYCSGVPSLYVYYAFFFSSFREDSGNPLQCSCLENPRDRGAWWAAVYGVTQSWTRLKRLSSSSSFFITQYFTYLFTVCLLSLYSNHNKTLSTWFNTLSQFLDRFLTTGRYLYLYIYI